MVNVGMYHCHTRIEWKRKFELLSVQELFRFEGFSGNSTCFGCLSLEINLRFLDFLALRGNDFSFSRLPRFDALTFKHQRFTVSPWRFGTLKVVEFQPSSGATL